MTTATSTKTDPDLHALLARIRDDPEAGPWALWARRLMEGDAKRKRKAVTKAKASTARLVARSRRA